MPMFQSPVSGDRFRPGYRTVLFGDSMTDTYETVNAAIPATYDPVTGVLTLSVTGHQQAVGWFSVVWNRTGSSVIKRGWRVPVLSVIDANKFTVNIGAGLVGVPTTNWFVRQESWRSAQAFVPWLQMVSGQRFNIVYNGARSGDTTQECLDRIEAECLSLMPQVVIMQMPGINDTSPGNGNLSEDTIAENQRTIIDRILAVGARIVLLTTTPPLAAEGRGNLANMMRVQRLNRLLWDYCAAKADVIFFDAHRRIVDPASATGTARANLIRSDNIHYSARGGRLIAEQMWSQIAPAFPGDYTTLPTSMIDNYWASAFTLTSVTRTAGIVTATISGGSPGAQAGEKLKLSGGSESFNEYVTLLSATATQVTFRTASGADGSITGTIRLGRSRNLVPNHLLTTATGGGGFSGATGTFAGNMRVVIVGGTPTVVGSVVPRADGFGNNQRVVITAASGTDQVTVQNDYTTYATDVPAMVRAGRSYVAECDLSMTGVAAASIREIRFNVLFTVGGVTYQTYALNGFNEGAYINTDFSNFHVRTAPLVMPAGAVGTCLWQLLVSFTGAGSALTVDIGRIRLEEAE